MTSGRPGSAADFDLRRLDVNLIVALQALLEEQNVSAAARRLGVSQPAASRSLQKLRRHFGDQLLVHGRGRSTPTPFAVALRPNVRDVVHGLSRVFASAGQFEPLTSERDFVVCATDYPIAVLGPRIIGRLAAEAPRCSVRFRPVPDRGRDTFAEHLTQVEAIVVPHGMDPPGESVDLFDDEWCCVLDAEHARTRDVWDVERLDALRWVATELHPGVVPGLDRLRARGLRARLAATTGTFTAVPYAVSGTDLAGIVQRRLADRLAETAGVTAIPLPGATAALNIVAFYDAARAQDPATRWFLDLLGEESRHV